MRTEEHHETDQKHRKRSRRLDRPVADRDPNPDSARSLSAARLYVNRRQNAFSESLRQPDPDETASHKRSSSAQPPAAHKIQEYPTMSIVRICSTVAFTMILGLGVAACEKHEQGPAEKVGAKIDHAAKDVKAAAKDAKEDIKDKAEDVKDELDD
jgi:hypothetical protein